ncbi:hypothetical protein MSG28_012495 [Choristoneura fumiferana]|uniref:Uncharacterized protein n=1 Tax=Choristoneura fumiferana TaxID=7141 RepID=A0ACC0KEE2_CHOFU|nr:hypothetical protein MSG28_012495 [Choristoneura fumiferana]
MITVWTWIKFTFGQLAFYRLAATDPKPRRVIRAPPLSAALLVLDTSGAERGLKRADSFTYGYLRNAFENFLRRVAIATTKLFVGGLSWETSQENLQRYFSRYGDVIDCVVMKNSESGRSRGFGFVTFAEPSLVNVVLQNGPHQLDGRALTQNRDAMRSEAASRELTMRIAAIRFCAKRVTEVSWRGWRVHCTQRAHACGCVRRHVQLALLYLFFNRRPPAPCKLYRLA